MSNPATIMRTGAIVAAVIVSALSLEAAPAQAEIFYPWCANPPTSDGGANNCGFDTIEQCREYLHGLGGFCSRNLWYDQAQRQQQQQQQAQQPQPAAKPQR